MGQCKSSEKIVEFDTFFIDFARRNFFLPFNKCDIMRPLCLLLLAPAVTRAVVVVLVRMPFAIVLIRRRRASKRGML